MKSWIVVGAVALGLAISAGSADAKQFKYQKSVTLKPGQSAILKGVRGNNCGQAMSWGELARSLPKSKLGSFSDGGSGTTYSGRCGKVVPARGVVFKATTPGKERVVIYGDPVSITVK